MSYGFVGDKSWRSEATYVALGDEDAEYPVVAMQNPDNEMSRIWRSPDSDLENTKFKIVFPQLRPVNVVALCNIAAARPLARAKISGYSDTAATQLVATTDWKRIWNVVYDLDDPAASWDSGNAWDRIHTELDIRKRYIDKALYFQTARLFKSIVVELDGVTECGICEPAAGFFLPLNYEYGAQYGIRSRSIVTTSAGGTDYVQEEQADELFIGNSSWIKRKDALSTFLEWLRRCDKHTPFWWSPDIDDEKNALRHSFLARNADVGLITNAAFQRDSVPFNFKRVI